VSLWRKRQVKELEMQIEKQDTLPETLAVYLVRHHGLCVTGDSNTHSTTATTYLPQHL